MSIVPPPCEDRVLDWIYTDEFPELPSTGGIDHAHILSDCHANTLGAPFPDTIATLLFRYNEQALRDFLDRTQRSFVCGMTKDSLATHLVVAREESRVFVRQLLFYAIEYEG